MFPPNTYYEQETRKWLINNPGKVVTLYQVRELFGAAFQLATTTVTAVNGLRASGIFIFNPDIFLVSVFESAETTDHLI